MVGATVASFRRREVFARLALRRTCWIASMTSDCWLMTASPRDVVQSRSSFIMFKTTG
jgi:hypothetical protein